MTTGLAGYWLMNEEGGGTLQDSGPLNNPLLMTVAGSWGPGLFEAAAFNCGNRAVYAASQKNIGITGGSARTISAWINPTNSDTLVDNIVSWGTNGVDTDCGFYVNVTNAGDVYWYFNGDDLRTVSGGIITPGIWQHICGVFYGGTAGTSSIGIFKNGLAQALIKEGASNSPNTGDSALRIGSIAVVTPGQNFRGSIDNVAVFRRALSASEVMALYANPFCLLARQRPRFIQGIRRVIGEDDGEWINLTQPA